MCGHLTAAESIAGAVWNGLGYAPIDAPIPNTSNLIGVSIHVQGFLLGGGTNNVGLSDGIEFVVGPYTN